LWTDNFANRSIQLVVSETSGANGRTGALTASSFTLDTFARIWVGELVRPAYRRTLRISVYIREDVVIPARGAGGCAGGATGFAGRIAVLAVAVPKADLIRPTGALAGP
jgi:hypothetical protein